MKMDSRADEFFVTVRSIDSMDYFPTNTCADFNVRLPYKIGLDGRWKVCVNEIWVSKQWFNLESAWIRLSVGENDFGECPLLDGYYDDNLTVIHELNRLVNLKSPGSVTFGLNQVNQTAFINTIENVKLTLSENICRLIGHDYGEHIPKDWVGQKGMDINEGFRMMLVCSDLIYAQLFSDNVMNVMKMIDSSYQYYGEIVHDNIASHRARVCKDTFDTIHVQIRNEYGKIFKCVGGSCAIHLHFTRQ